MLIRSVANILHSKQGIEWIITGNKCHDQLLNLWLQGKICVISTSEFMF